MWKLTVYQKRKLETSSYETTEAISYESEEIAPLLIMVSNLSKLEAAGNTKYEICEVPKEKCVKEEEKEEEE